MRFFAVLLSLFVASSAAADQQECVAGEYVLQVAPITALRNEALADANAASVTPLVQTRQNNRIILVKERRTVGLGEQVVALSDIKNNFCTRLRSNRRHKLLTRKWARNYTCSCNGVFRAAQIPNDPHFGVQWGLHQTSDIDMDVPEAWDLSVGSRSIVLGVIDSGVEYTHEDLRDNMWQNEGEIAGNNIDDDGNGYIDDRYGLNAITYDGSTRRAGDPRDDNGHGTHVAGTIGASTNNAKGVAGVTQLVRIVPIKFLDSSGSGSLVDAIEAVDYATNLKRRGVNLILTNNSWGGGGYYQALVDSIRAARDEGILFVAAAGNNTNNNDQSPSYPASYTLDNIISVAAVNSAGQLSSFSNYGATSVDIGAPGERIASTYLNNGYVYLSGTSMATPKVSGALALLKAYSYGLSWEALKSTLLSTGDPLPALSGKTLTGKMANANNMLRAVPHNPAPPPGQYQPGPTPTPTPQPTATPPPPPTPTASPGNWDITGQVTAGGASLANARVELQTSSGSAVRMTDGNGQFSFPDVAGPIAYTIIVTKSGFTFSPLTGFLLRDTSHSISAQARTFTLTVQVYTPERNPVGGILVNAGAYGSGTTNSEGKIDFSIPSNVAYNVALSSNSYRLVESTLGGQLLGNTTRVAIARP